jgi:Arc/MetJ family transcription regulator
MFTLIEEGHVVTGCSSLRHVVGRYGARSRLWRDLAKVGASRLNRRLSRLRRIHGP